MSQPIDSNVKACRGDEAAAEMIEDLCAAVREGLANPGPRHVICDGGAMAIRVLANGTWRTLRNYEGAHPGGGIR